MKRIRTEAQKITHAQEQRDYRRRRGSVTGYWCAASKKARVTHPDKKAAWGAVYKAITRGKIIRPNKCEKCGRVCRPQAHHEDYAKRLEIQWLCRPCHLEVNGHLARIFVNGDPAAELRGRGASE